MGWNAARTYNASTLIRGRTYNISINSQSRYVATDIAVRNGIRIIPWYVASAGSNQPVPLWVSYRTRTRGDANISAGWDDMVRGCRWPDGEGHSSLVCLQAAAC